MLRLFFHWLLGIRPKPGGEPVPLPPPRVQLTVELLEERTILSTSPLLLVEGNQGADELSVEQDQEPVPRLTPPAGILSPCCIDPLFAAGVEYILDTPQPTDPGESPGR